MPPTLTIAPQSALFDQPVTIYAGGLQPGQQVEIESSVQYPWTPGLPWKALAKYRANAAGELFLVHDSAGSAESEQDPMRLFWNLHPQSSQIPARGTHIELDTRQPLPMIFRLMRDGQELAAATIERCFQSDEIQAQPYTAEGVRGQLFYNPSQPPLPGILFLSGSGTLAPILPISALLASYGYTVLALGYFGAEGLPSQLVEIPIERFEAAIGWLSDQPAVIKDRIGVMGGSLGGELALLVGALDARVKAVAAIAPSPVIFSEFGAGLASKSAGAPWSYQGQALPFASAKLGRLFWEIVTQALRGRPFRYSPAYRAALQHPKAYHPAMIPVESIHGPILLVSGTDDGYWPATDLCEIALGRLKENSFSHPVYHLGYAGAGHSFYAPYLLPTSSIETQVMRGVRFTSGGTPALNSQAQADSWSKILRFFQQHL